MSGIPWEDEESQNYIRAEHIVTVAVKNELRSFFIQEWNKRYQASPGEWDDTNVSGSHLCNFEKLRVRPNKTMLQTKFKHGDTNEWDCTVLFDAILYSHSIGASLNPTQKTEIDNLRKLRNEITHKPVKTLDETDFQMKTTIVENALNALGLSINEVVRIKNLFASFKVLPPKPTHEVVSRSDEVREIRENLEKLHSDSSRKLTYFYISGNPGSGKSQLARQVCEDICNDIDAKDEAMFLMTLNGKDLDSLFYSYEDFCRRVNCNESVLINVSSSSKPTDEKIKDLRSQISSRIKNWKKWWIIVDNVENLELISPLLPLIGDEVWNNGQIILTTQNTNAIPSDGVSTKHNSISVGMRDQDCRQLLSLLSKTNDNNALLDEVAKKLDRQPLALAAAALYMRLVIESCPDFSWREYLDKIEKGKRKSTEERLRKTNSAAYPLTMTTAMRLAVEKCAEYDTILDYAFKLFSLISFEPLPLDLVVKFIQQQDEDIDTVDIILAIRQCSLFIYVGKSQKDIRLHRVVHETVKTFCLLTESEIENLTKTGISNKAQNIRRIFHVVKTLYSFQNREDKIKLIPHLKTFYPEIIKLLPKETLYELYISIDNNEICAMYRFFADTLRYYSEFNLSIEFLQVVLRLYSEKLGSDHVYIADSYCDLGTVYNDKGDQEQASYFLHQALKIGLKQPERDNVNIARYYNNLGSFYRKKGDFNKARECYGKALQIKLKQLGPDNIEVADSYNNISTVCCDPERAGNYYQQALDIFLKQLGPNHIKVAGTYNNLGMLCIYKDKLSDARTNFLRALTIQEDQLGPDHIDVASSYDNLGEVCLRESDLHHAKEYFQRALDIRSRQMGANQISVATSYDHLGSLCLKKRDMDYARYFRQLAFGIISQQTKQKSVATSNNQQGIVSFKGRDLDDARDYFQRALDIRLVKFDQNHIDVARSYENLGEVCLREGDIPHASKYFRRVYDMQLEKFWATQIGPDVLFDYLGKICLKGKDLDHARDYFQLALDIRLKNFGRKHFDVASSYYNLGAVCFENDDIEDAHKHFKLAMKCR
ncbi:uncharacterized protein LOC114536091 [Dendronephthya gigantea]|uniref:uncharacterized protein LOC114536091 n=1 Tax=Dendronephthya gigantea TaxID=151771 RepID=UPI00106B4F1F|nr:uncharacterized protein LOC114536091 [Dendronephthya gigantea]